MPNTSRPHLPKPLVAVAANFRHFDGHPVHLVPDTYVDAVADVSGGIPLIIPAIGKRTDVDGLLARIDGLVLPGSPSNVYPPLYGEEPTPDHEPYDHDRDATVMPLIRAAIAQGVPLLAICRGFQELNVALGGTLHTEIQTIPGRMDHRAPEHPERDTRYGIRQDVTIIEGCCLARIAHEGHARVNSLHRQGVGRLADSLSIDATAPDGTIEAVTVHGARTFAMGMQWHPEYWAATDPLSRKIFEAFGDAIRARAQTRL
jgi:putative glutamine amidotransferase